MDETNDLMNEIKDLTKEQQRMFFIQQAYATLFSVNNKIQVQGDRALGELTSRQYMALLAILHIPDGEVTLNSIASKLGNTKQSTKHIIDILKKKGYVSVVPSEKDKRAINITISDLGMEILKYTTSKGNTFLEKLFNSFTYEEVHKLWQLLGKLYAYDGDQQDGFEERPITEE
ncbi:MAG: MarR family winged helix-turn-helix transcriptional regulator [Coprobacillaceae bacterium]